MNLYSLIFWSFSSNARCNKEKQAILFKVILNINLQGGKTNAHLSRYCTVQKVTYKNKIAIHAKSFMLNFNIGAKCCKIFSSACSCCKQKYKKAEVEIF